MPDLITQLQSTLANHAETMSLLPPNDSIASKMREIDIILHERIISLGCEVGEAQSAPSASAASTGSAQAALTITQRTPVSATENGDLTGHHTRDHQDMSINPEEIDRFGQRPPPLQIVAVQPSISAPRTGRNRRRGRFKSSTLNKMAPTPVNTPFLGKPMK
ncbi:hypothetical protein LB503_002279 [Fusarium chuoi]|nr:hypothetical protein LB503_002279 [Fusarium chuoi]